MKGRRGSGVGKRHSLNGESRAAPAGMFPILPLGHSGPWSSLSGCLICQTKVVNACLASEVLGRLGSSTSGRQELQRPRGRTVPEALRGNVGRWAAPCGAPSPPLRSSGLKALPRKAKAPRSAGAWGHRAPQGGWAKRDQAARSGSARPGPGPGHVARGRDRTARASPGPFSR